MGPIYEYQIVVRWSMVAQEWEWWLRLENQAGRHVEFAHGYSMSPLKARRDAERYLLMAVQEYTYWRPTATDDPELRSGEEV
jgi:hypothetical protein